MARILRFVQLMTIASVILLMAVLLGRAFVTLYRLLQRLVEALEVEALVDYTLVTVLVGGLLLLLYLIVGRRTVGRRAPEALGYRKAGGSKHTGTPSSTDSQSVLVYINGGWQPALLIERAVSGTSVVYIPQAPNARSGAIYVVESFQVTPLNMPTSQMQEIVSHWGEGLCGHADKLFQTH